MGQVERAMNLLRRVLQYQVSVEALIEVALWLAVAIGVELVVAGGDLLHQLRTGLNIEDVDLDVFRREEALANCVHTPGSR